MTLYTPSHSRCPWATTRRGSSSTRSPPARSLHRSLTQCVRRTGHFLVRTTSEAGPAGEATFPAAVEDAKAAIRFLRANAGAYKLNATTIVAWGQSAGAHIAQMLGTSAGVAALEGAHLGNAAYSSQVQAVINQYGPTAFALMDAQLAAQGCPASARTHNQADSPESRYLGAALPTVPHLVTQANPLTYLSAHSAPTLVEKGSADCIVPVHQSVLLYNALKEAGVRTEYVLLQGTGHGGPEFDTPANIERMLAFLTSVVP